MPCESAQPVGPDIETDAPRVNFVAGGVLGLGWGALAGAGIIGLTALLTFLIGALARGGSIELWGAAAGLVVAPISAAMFALFGAGAGAVVGAVVGAAVYAVEGRVARTLAGWGLGAAVPALWALAIAGFDVGILAEPLVIAACMFGTGVGAYVGHRGPQEIGVRTHAAT
jgi:hypothetical protein